MAETSERLPRQADRRSLSDDCGDGTSLVCNHVLCQRRATGGPVIRGYACVRHEPAR